MKLNYNVNGEKRKRLVQLMAEIIGCKPRYLGVPSYAYQVGGYHIDKNGLHITFFSLLKRKILLIRKRKQD